MRLTKKIRWQWIRRFTHSDIKGTGKFLKETLNLVRQKGKFNS